MALPTQSEARAVLQNVRAMTQWMADITAQLVPAGGTTGQVLTKHSNADFDVDWETGGGGGGSTSPLTTKGDIWGYSTVDARVPVGANGRLLQADSAQTLGVQYAAMSGDATIAVGGALTLANSGVTAATYGDATHVTQVAFDAKGRATSASSVAITFPSTGQPLYLASYPGILTAGVESPRWYPTASVTLTALRLSLLASSASNLVVEFNKNGSSAHTITLSASGVTQTDSISVSLTTSDYVTVTITSAGTDAADASIEAA